MAHGPRLESLPGISSAVTEINRQIAQFAQTARLVFITGEQGTEKSLVAKLLHQQGSGSDKPLGKVAVSWKMPPELVAHVERAADSTLVVVLHREFPIDMQYSIVEMISHGYFTDPMSGRSLECPGMRLVLLTSMGFEQLMSGKTCTLLPELRELLGEHRIHVPPLRDRTEDIPALVRYAINRAKETGRSQATGADAQVLALFRHWSWPNNAEDLLLVTAQAAITAKEPLITLTDLPEEFLGQMSEEDMEAARQVRPPRQPTRKPPRRRAAAPPTASFDLHSEPTPIPLPGGIAARGDEHAPVVARDGEDVAPETPATSQDQILVSRRLLNLAKRLTSQSTLLSRQMTASPLRKFRSDDGVKKPVFLESEEDVAAGVIEGELERGIDMVLALRRQVAVLNKRQRDSITTFKDLFLRLNYADDQKSFDNPEVEREKQALARQLASINEIIASVSDKLPELGEHFRAFVMESDPTRGAANH